MQGSVCLAITVSAVLFLLLACTPATPAGVPSTLPVYRTSTVVLSSLSGVTNAPATATKPAVTPLPTSTVVPIQWLVVTNTDGMGVYLRNSPNMEDKTVALPDGTRLRVIGPDTENEGRRWKQVADPKGRTGWVPVEYTAPVVGP
jgi:hypothetical protein